MHWIDLLIAEAVEAWPFLLATVLLLLALPIAAIVLRRRRQRINVEALGEEASKLAGAALGAILMWGMAILFPVAMAFTVYRAAMYAWGLLQ
jgi:hypothetical protein